MRGTRIMKKARQNLAFFHYLAERKGLEPSASGVTGRRYNRLNYRSASSPRFFRSRGTSLPGKNRVVGGTGVEPVTLGL